jgi:DNA ligase (NAD+)
MTQNIETMHELIERIAKADTAYYKHDTPVMTDREYDALCDELAELEQSTGIILSGSPSLKVSGEVLESLTRIPHTKPMLSAQKTKSIDEVIKFIGDRQAVVSWKLDGLILVLRYEGGKLVRALTCGGEGGTIGEDVTHSVRVMANVPLEIPYTEPFEIRGEGVISWKNFEAANDGLEENEPPYIHPRSLAAGSIRRLDARKTKSQSLEFFAFDLISDDGRYVSKTAQFEMLRENGFGVVYNLPVGEGTGDIHAKAIINCFDPKGSGYPVDGLIIEYDDTVYGKSLGATGHHENRLIALKWEDELYETTFLGLETATTRTGMVSLTGMFEDVIIDGTTVNRAYLHNLDIVDSFGLGVGDRVKIYKANMIIPQLAENITRSGTLEYPKACPCCDSELTIRASGNGTRLLFCENPSCPAKLVRKFVPTKK